MAERPERTLTDEDVAESVTAMRSALSQEFGATER